MNQYPQVPNPNQPQYPTYPLPSQPGQQPVQMPTQQMPAVNFQQNGQPIQQQVYYGQPQQGMQAPLGQYPVRPKKSIYKKWWFWVIIGVVLLGVGGAVAGGQAANTSRDSSASSMSASTSASAVNAASASSTKSSASAQSSSSAQSVPKEYQNALRKAESYSSMMHMSKQGIYDQLVSEYGEGFSPEAAQYAIDNVNADWKANAFAKAESYQESMAMSPSAIYDQLISDYGEKFTSEEAQYAIDHLSQ